MSDTPNFEKTMAELEKVVTELEKGDLPLDTALKTFESGVALAEKCQKQLGDAELRVEKIMAKNGQVSVEDME